MSLSKPAHTVTETGVIILSDSEEDGAPARVRRLIPVAGGGNVALNRLSSHAPSPVVDAQRVGSTQRVVRGSAPPRKKQRVTVQDTIDDGESETADSVPVQLAKAKAKKKKKCDPKFRAWCFTHHKKLPGDENAEHRFRDRCIEAATGHMYDAGTGSGAMFNNYYQVTDVTGMVCGDEICPTTGRPHFQGCIVFKNPKQLTQVTAIWTKVFGIYPHMHTHLEPTKGSSDDNTVYCSKEQTLINDLPQFGRGARNDWHKFRDSILEGKTDHELNMLFPQKCAQHHGYIGWTRFAYQKDNTQALPLGTRKTMGIWICGPTAIGKSSMLSHKFTDKAYWLDGKWWCGYHNEPLVVIDDPLKPQAKHYGCELKRVVVEHPVNVEPKFGHACVRPRQFVVLSNETMRGYFGDNLSPALESRFTQVNVDTREQLEVFYNGWTHIGQDLTNWCDVSKKFMDPLETVSQPATEVQSLPDCPNMADFFPKPGQ